MNNINNFSLIQASKVFLIGLCLFVFSATASARGVYESSDDFLAGSFGSAIPQSKVVWLRGEVRESVADILGHAYVGLRIRYWREDNKTAWILEEIGKVEPITFGVVIAAGKIAQMKVLTYRESRGEQIRYPAFTRQYDGAILQENQLDRKIDGISGATLSVRAMSRVARLALYLHSYVVNTPSK